MKLITSMLEAFALATRNPVTASAADNESACGAVLCLASVMASGPAGGSQCTGYIASYFFDR